MKDKLKKSVIRKDINEFKITMGRKKIREENTKVFCCSFLPSFLFLYILFDLTSHRGSIIIYSVEDKKLLPKIN
jgi:hypothetical protein